MSALEVRDGGFRLHGREHRILAGSIHYFRVPDALWRDRLERLAALGLNTIDTYVAWNVHEETEGQHRFDGWRDLERFLRTAADVGLDAIVRPSPYICAEWSNGGLPGWLTARERSLRSSAPGFLAAVEAWYDALLPRLVPLQATHGGPIVAMQIENEYGSFGDDPGYLEHQREALRSRGVVELLYTADGNTAPMSRRGSIDGTLAAYTFGTDAAAADRLRAARGDEVLFCAEYWNGWFDHWGEPHHTRSAASAASTLGEILELGGSVSIYMAHGGTNHGLWAGANHDGERIQPTVTSYDSDAPVGEDGRIGEKFHALRTVLEPYAARPLPPVPRQPRMQSPATAPINAAAALAPALEAMADAVATPLPPTFEDLGLFEGLVLHTTRTVLEGQPLSIPGLRDRAAVLIEGRMHGVLDRNGATELPMPAIGEARIDLIVETQGRINYGHRLGEHKGITGGVLLERALVHGWQSRALHLGSWDASDLTRLTSAGGHVAGQPGVGTATLHVDAPADAWLALPGAEKAFVWLNGALLGRLWSRGPQRTLYAPAPLWRDGENTLVVLDLERLSDAVEVVDAPELGESEEFVERLEPARP